MTATRIYIADVSSLNDAATFKKYFGEVSARRREKINRLHFQNDKCLSLGAELLLQRACRDFGINFANESVEVNEYGKPFFASRRVRFNLSHSGARAMCIMSEKNVGCDVERIDNSDFRDVAKFFSRDEVRQIFSHDDLDEQRDNFYRIWTLKESFVKCIGRGFEISPDEFTILSDKKPVGVVQNIIGGSFTFGEVNLNDEYKYSWCVKDEFKSELVSSPSIKFYAAFP